MSDGDNEFPLVIESNSDDHIDQKRFIPASELLKRSKVSSSFLILFASLHHNKLGHADTLIVFISNFHIAHYLLFLTSQYSYISNDY